MEMISRWLLEANSDVRWRSAAVSPTFRAFTTMVNHVTTHTRPAVRVVGQ